MPGGPRLAADVAISPATQVDLHRFFTVPVLGLHAYDLMFSTLNERKDPLDKIDKACRKTVGIYPAYFEFDFQRPDPGLFEMNIRRCFFRDFFDRHDARLVTTVMCAFDVNFMKAIDPSVSGLRAERTSLLSLGDDQCRFAVLETDDPLAGYTDKLDERFVGKQQSG
jgi:hypothetical protein